jgi:hypothetical protein
MLWRIPADTNEQRIGIMACAVHPELATNGFSLEGSPSYAKASEGILLRATALQGLFCVVRSGKQNGGWGGIRTHGALARTPVFKTGALNRSATHPGCACYSVRGDRYTSDCRHKYC